jgi:GNAT superfamily N-acetyltransferase/predicted nucleic acid-binding protein
MPVATKVGIKINPDAMVTIEPIDADSPLLEAVITLHRSCGQNLGMFPRGAFVEHACSKWILVAHEEKGNCLGYLLYREAKERATIVHLCVRPESRSKGVGRALIERLKADTKHLRGIGLYCRRDYEARAAWPRYGFAPVGTKRGRGADGAELEFWWLDHNHPDLFSLAAASQPESKLRVVIDANVFYDLYERHTPESEESKALLADWLQEEIELLLTREIHFEVSRAPTEAQRKRSSALISRHQVLRTDDAKVQQVIAELQSHFPAAACPRDDSDLRQIAHTIAADVSFFVTRDDKLIECSEPLIVKYGLRVLHPTELINQIDSLRREAQYRPVRIEGSRLVTGLLRADQVDAVITALRRAPREKIAEFEKTIRLFLAKPTEYECTVALADDKTPIALLTRSAAVTSSMCIPMFRLSGHSLASTVGRNLLRSLLERSSTSPRLIEVNDQEMGNSERSALSELGFLHSEGCWLKVGVTGLTTLGALKNSLERLKLPVQARTFLFNGLDAYENSATSLGAADIEKAFWPAKLKDAPIPSFLVPIQAQWAEHFFDTGLASERLFGLRNELHLGIEGAYYCSAIKTVLKHPGRVVWYVSKGPEGRGSMAVKACSRIEEVMIGKPKDLFKKLSRLGVYEWRDIFKTAEGDVNKSILAFRFSMTERFAKPVDLTALKELGIAPPIMSSRRITANQFEKIYTIGKQL